MSIEKQPKRPLPYATTKLGLVAMYQASGLPKKVIIDAIQDIMFENRKDNFKLAGKSRNAKCVMHKELMLFVEQFGLPDGFASDDEFKKL
jgi:hypothetical protein